MSEDLMEELADLDDNDVMTKKKVTKLLAIQQRLHKKEQKKLMLQQEVSRLSSEDVEVPTKQEAQEQNQLASQVQEENLMNAATLPSDNIPSSEPTEAATPQGAPAQQQAVSSDNSGAQPANSQEQQAPQGAPAPNSLLAQMPLEVKNALMQEALGVLKAEERQAVMQKTQDELNQSKQQIANNMKDSFENNPEFKESAMIFNKTFSPDIQQATIGGMIDLLATDEDAVDVIQKMMGSIDLMNQYISLGANPVQRAKLLSRVKNQVISEKFSSIPNGSKGDFGIPTGSSASKSPADMNSSEYRSYMKKQGRY